ncbi:MAG TPA: hypothetical protein VKS22_00790 [Candidatus Binataceae bacterium]|nr:hypothetical protein [Candidatus Binataceae bacterium]
MRLCVGTAKGIVILDPDRGATPRMVSADPPSVWCLAQDCAKPNLLYAGSIHNAQAGSARGKGALALSDDGGRSWRDITPGIARDEEVWALAAAPDRSGEVFVGASNARLLRSEDAGRSFRECLGFLKLPGRDRWTFPQPPHIPHVRSISFNPHDANTIYVGVEEGGAFRSRDRGRSFEPLSQNIYADIHCLAADRNDPHRLYATTGGGFYVSTTGGAAWTLLKGLGRPYVVPLLPLPGGIIYTAAAGGPPPTWSMDQIGANALMYRSTDHGVSFTPIAQADGNVYPTRGMVMRLIAQPGDERILFGALSDGTVIRMDERDDTVAIVAEKLPPAFDLVALP